MNRDDAATLRRAIALVRFVRDPALPGLLLGAGLVVAGFAMLVLAVFGVAGVEFVPLQSPYLLSGGVGGLALVAVGVVVFTVQAERRDLTDARHEIDRLGREVIALVRTRHKDR